MQWVSNYWDFGDYCPLCWSGDWGRNTPDSLDRYGTFHFVLCRVTSFTETAKKAIKEWVKTNTSWPCNFIFNVNGIVVWKAGHGREVQSVRLVCRNISQLPCQPHDGANHYHSSWSSTRHICLCDLQCYPYSFVVELAQLMHMVVTTLCVRFKNVLSTMHVSLTVLHWLGYKASNMEYVSMFNGIYTYICTCAYTYTHINKNIHTHTHAYTHIYLLNE